MPNRITKTRWVSRLFERFGVVPGKEAGTTYLWNGVVPVVSTDELLREELMLAQNVTSALSAYIAMFTVTDGERWRVHSFTLIRQAGDRTLSELALQDPDGNVIITGLSTATTYLSGILSEDMRLDQGWSFRVLFTGGSTDGAWAVRVYYSREESF